MSTNKKQSDPLQNLFVDIKKILQFIELKNKNLADAYETEETRDIAEIWLNCMDKVDSYLTYKNWWKKYMFFEVDTNVKNIDVQKYISEPYNVPLKYRENLLIRGREAFLEQFEEQNDYYRMLTGLPGVDDTEYIYLSEELQEKYGVGNIPVHQLSTHIQNLYMNTDEYEEVLEDNPDKGYLKYLGSKKIDLYTARKAKDFDIIRYPNDRNDINPLLLNAFSELYDGYREYVMVVLYNKQLEDVYEGYRDFMGMIIIAFVLFQIGNKALDEKRKNNFLDDSTIYTLLSMYGIPDSLTITKETRRRLASNLMKLIREKGTDDVYYDIIDILGYQDVTIRKLMLMKGQQFDQNSRNDVWKAKLVDRDLVIEYTASDPPDIIMKDDGLLVFTYDEEEDDTYHTLSTSSFYVNDDGNLILCTNAVVPYFLGLDILDENPYKTITENKAPIYYYNEIIKNDPYWWDTKEVRDIIEGYSYTSADSKYITIEATMHQMQYMFESIYFSRMILDNKINTAEYMINIPALFGSEMIPIYDLVLALVCATCMTNGLTGEIFNSNKYDQFSTNYVWNAGIINKDLVFEYTPTDAPDLRLDGGNLIFKYDETDTTYETLAATRFKINDIGNLIMTVDEDIVYPTNLLITPGFNFELDMDLFEEFLDSTTYVEKQKIRNFLSDLIMNDVDDITRLFNNVLTPMRQWLENKIVDATDRAEFLEYEMIYKSLFTYDASRNKFLDNFEMPIEIIRQKYGLGEDEMTMLKHFYPRTLDGKAIMVDDFNESVNNTRYHYPFLSLTDEVDWYIHVIIESSMGTEDRGYVYFHDILNCDDLRELTNPDGTRVFMDYEDEDIGWQLNEQAVQQAMYLIDSLDDDDLLSAFIQVYTPILNSDGEYYEANQTLPAILRSSCLFKSILKDKIAMDMDGLCVPADTYFELLYRTNASLYSLLVSGNRFETDRDAWLNDVMIIVTSIEEELDLHMKYYEESIVGKDLFFKPLVTLINRFKSVMVDIIRTDTKLIFDDKMDVGGNSNMFKLFDSMKSSIHFTTISGAGYNSQFGALDVIHKTRHKSILKDRSEVLKMMYGEGFAAETRTKRMGSMRMVDEMKFFKNGKELDPSGHTSMWYSGEPGTGRWSEEDDVLFRTRKGVENVLNNPVDLEGWKDFVESYNYE